VQRMQGPDCAHVPADKNSSSAEKTVTLFLLNNLPLQCEPHGLPS
jgi:hypothetical protein